MTKWCEVCDEIEATCCKSKGVFTTCYNCYMRLRYWQKKGPGALMERRKNLRLYMRTNSIMLGDMDVHDIEEQREKKVA